MGANPALAGLVVSVMRRPVAVVMSVMSISLLVDDAGPGATLCSISVCSSGMRPAMDPMCPFVGSVGKAINPQGLVRPE
jgi:hypothetical protein